ncbi:ribonuclease domain-containing protein [Alkalibacterium pelagium]|uniref:Ribonuclease n=1 Tax=Alkalibacterium pelagium TaxID=426702 RepID=A0A1H7PB91_9LACT|nr:ribonuclease domain-containing protein [Alkalibacterium pelagium]GEN51611.1 hypothetical protein APE02nite_22760 [Alkalibacterium pelagium]SEL33041.1 ribonuclease [Alkalibacterium pelagium]
MTKRLITLTLLWISLILSGCAELETLLEDVTETTQTSQEEGEDQFNPDLLEGLDAEGYYSSPEDVALYIYTFEELPENYMTKEEARELGWEASEGNLWDVTDEMLIGGDYFRNREGLLPEEDGRRYFEADVNYEGGYRGAERLVYSNDGLIYYTDDHYDSFTLLYGEE